MENNCPKCKQPKDSGSPLSCLKCGAIYAKVAAHQQQQAEKQAEIERAQERLARQKQIKAEEDHLAKRSICTQCGYTGQPITITKGSIWIEITLWLCFLVPGLIYSIWRLSSKYKACPQCKHNSMIPASSPHGRKLYKETE